MIPMIPVYAVIDISESSIYSDTRLSVYTAMLVVKDYLLYWHLEALYTLVSLFTLEALWMLVSLFTW